MTITVQYSAASKRIPCMMWPSRMPAGNGSQWPLMAADLLESSSVFRAAIEECARALEPMGIDLVAQFACPDGWGVPALATVGLCATQASSSRPLCLHCDGQKCMLYSAISTARVVCQQGREGSRKGYCMVPCLWCSIAACWLRLQAP